MSGQGGGDGGGSGLSPEAALQAGGATLSAEAACEGQRPPEGPAGSASRDVAPGWNTGSQGQSRRGDEGAMPRPSEEPQQAQGGDDEDDAACSGKESAQGHLATRHALPEPEPEATLASPAPHAEAASSGREDSSQSSAQVAQGHQAARVVAGQVQPGAGLGLASSRQGQTGAPVPAAYVSLDLSNSSSPDRRGGLDAEGSGYGANAHAVAQRAQQVLEDIERDAAVAGESVGELLGQLSAFLHEATANTAAHVEVERDAAGLLQTAALDAAARGNKMVNSYLRLHEELRDLPQLCLRVKTLRQHVDLFDSQLRHFLSR